MKDETDDVAPSVVPPRSGETSAPTSGRLDGPDALLTGEWNVADLPELEARPIPEAPPVPPSRRKKPASAPEPTITVPKKPLGMLEAPAAPVHVPSLELMGTTLPRAAERGEAALAGAELPSIETDSELAAPGWREQLRRHRPLAAVATVLVASLTYSVVNGLLQRREIPRGAEASIPAFLVAAEADREHSGAGSEPPMLQTVTALAEPMRAASDGGNAPTDGSQPVTPEAGAGPAMSPPSPVAYSTAAVASASAAPIADAPGAQAPARRRRVESTHASKASPVRSGPPAAPRVTSYVPERASASLGAQGKAASSSSESTSGSAAPTMPGDGAARVRPLTTYRYASQTLFAITTAPRRVTDLVLEPGEVLASRPTTGDAARWIINVLESRPGQELQQHVFVQPLRPGLRTNLTLTTNRRSYFLELTSRVDGEYMAGVAWTYPKDIAEQRREAVALAARERQNSTRVANLNALRFDYRIDVTAGVPSWKPTLVFDDGEKTFIRFARPLIPAEAPLLFVLRSGATKDAQYINYRVKNDLYVLDRVIDTVELRRAGPPAPSGGHQTAAQDVVRITRRRGAP